MCGLVESGGSNILEIGEIMSDILERVEIVIMQHLNYKERSIEPMQPSDQNLYHDGGDDKRKK